MNKFLLPTMIVAMTATGALAHDMLHASHDDHAHGDGCGHVALAHLGHVDYLHDGHLHSPHDGHVDEHTLAVSATNPDAEAFVERVSSDDHRHGHDGEEHDMVQHGAHYDFIHDGRLHNEHGDHTDDHGPVSVVPNG